MCLLRLRNPRAISRRLRNTTIVDSLLRACLANFVVSTCMLRLGTVFVDVCEGAPKKNRAVTTLAFHPTFDNVQKEMNRTGGVTHLKQVNTHPIHKHTTLATALPFLLYLSGLPPYPSSPLCAVAPSTPVTHALCVATIYVYASAQPSVNIHASTEQIFQARFTPRDSLRSGQNKSKKKADPKIVAT